MNSTAGVFNVLDNWGAGFGMIANDSSLTTAQNNAAALLAAVNAAVDDCASPAGQHYGNRFDT